MNFVAFEQLNPCRYLPRLHVFFMRLEKGDHLRRAARLAHSGRIESDREAKEPFGESAFESERPVT